MSILNRLLRWTATGVEFEPDPRHVEIAEATMGLDFSSKAASTPWAKGIGTGPPAETEGTGTGHPAETEGNGTGHPAETEDPELSTSAATEFRALVARLNYLAQDRYELAYPCKELCRSMAGPR